MFIKLHWESTRDREMMMSSGCGFVYRSNTYNIKPLLFFLIIVTFFGPLSCAANVDMVKEMPSLGSGTMTQSFDVKSSWYYLAKSDNIYFNLIGYFII